MKCPSHQHPCHPRDPAQASYQSTKWVFKLHRLGCEPGHSRIPPDGALWKICKEQLSHLDLNSGEAEAPPTLCPLVADVTCLQCTPVYFHTWPSQVIVGLNEPEVRSAPSVPFFLLCDTNGGESLWVFTAGGVRNSSHRMS